MKRRVILVGFLSLFLGIPGVWAQDIELVECEYSDEYIAWTKLSTEEQEKTQKPFICKSIGPSSSIMSSNNDYTLSKFTLQDHYVLDVRNQQDSDTCWAFASLASIESNLLKNKISTDYLSVSHLELSSQDSLYTPSYVTFHRNLNSGGFFEFTNAYVLNNRGPVLESVLPFQTLLNIIHQNQSISKLEVENQKASVDVDNIMLLQNEQGACSSDDITLIKKYLVNYGGLAAGIHFAQTDDDLDVKQSGDKFELIYKYLNGAYYYYDGSTYHDLNGASISANQLSNHAVLIVGWDDDVEVASFSSAKPSRKGAWIVKNSYGKEENLEISEDYEVTIKQGDEGYFYVSYDDINICTNIAGYFDVDNKVSDYAYYYDDLGYNIAYIINGNDLYVGNVFNKMSDKTEKIDKITFANYQPNTKYTVYLSKNKNFTNMQEIGSGVATYNGYISLIPNSEIYATDQFSIIVKYEVNEGNDLIVPFASATNLSSLYDNFKLSSNKSFVSLNGIDWVDTNDSDLEAQNSIRVYTTEVKQDVSSEVDSNDEIQNDANIIVNNRPSTSSNNTSVGDTSIKDDINDIENPSTGGIQVVLALIVLLITGIGVHHRIKNKMWKL